MPVGVFDGSPPSRLLRLNDMRMHRRVAFLIVLTWVPLVVLSVLQELFAHDGSIVFFLRDVAVHARFIVAVPLLVIGESWCVAKLSQCASYFQSSGTVSEPDRNMYDGLLRSTARLMNSKWVQILCLILTYAVVFTFLNSVFRSTDLPKWHVSWRNGRPLHSAAGYWHLLISMPVLIFLLLGWVWRQIVWLRLLILTSRLHLRLVAAHPDRAGGLRFLSTVLRGYWPLCFAVGATVAGRAANQVLAGSSLSHFSSTVIGLLALLLAFILIPLTVFIPTLIDLREQGPFGYGTLADALGRQFETQWMKCPESITSSALEAPDFSATTDLYSIVANTLQIQLFPAGIRAIIELVVMTLIPFVPVVLATLPLDTILRGIGKILI
jgi:hypothetical protein